MTLTLPMLLQLVWASIRTPRDAARAVMASGVPHSIRWQMLFAFVLIGVILAIAITWLITGNPVLYLGIFPAAPVAAAVVSLTASVLTVYAIYWIGHAMGGTGSFGDAVLLVAWVQFIVICLQLAQLGVFVLLPPLAGLVDIAASLMSLWILTNFIAELHGFRSLAKVFLMILVSLFGFAFAVSLILAIVGVSIPGMPS